MKSTRKFFPALGLIALLTMASIGWVVFFMQKPDILAKARARYIQATKFENKNLEKGPCLGKIADDWVLDIAHLPREPVDDQPENQCADFRQGKVHHFVEMSPRGEIILVR